MTDLSYADVSGDGSQLTSGAIRKFKNIFATIWLATTRWSRRQKFFQFIFKFFQLIFHILFVVFAQKKFSSHIRFRKLPHWCAGIIKKIVDDLLPGYDFNGVIKQTACYQFY